jgi:acetoin utilization protein AcuC
VGCITPGETPPAGFCLFNDIGVAILAARKKYGIMRVAYVDIDAHHGDGVFYEFEDDPLLFFADIHEVACIYTLARALQWNGKGEGGRNKAEHTS